MTPEEEERYRQEVRAELSKKNDEKVKERIRREEETRVQGGSLWVAAKKIWGLWKGD